LGHWAEAVLVGKTQFLEGLFVEFKLKLVLPFEAWWLEHIYRV
jgi:hypothetical protein